MSKEFKFNNKQDMWTEKYRPQTIDDCILPARYKETFNGLVAKKTIPHLLLSGVKGLGKTSVGLALCAELGYEVLFINASKDRGIEVLRNNITTFAAGKSLTGKKKVVFLDEADHMTSLTQHSLRGVMEDKRILSNCRFILTCNHPTKIIDELHSRCSGIEFSYTKEDNLLVATQFMKRIKEILEVEDVKYDMHIIAQIIKRFLPDFRRVINELQLLSVTGTIPENALTQLSDGYIKDICDLLKSQEYGKLTEWVFTNTHVQFADMIVPFYKQMSREYLVNNSIPLLPAMLSSCDKGIAMGANDAIQKLELFVDIMATLDFK